MNAQARNKYKQSMKRAPITSFKELMGPPREDEEFLNKIAMLESSGGINTDHKMMESGIHKDTKAVGTFGIMPNTAQEIGRRVKRRDHRLNLAKEFQGDPEIEMFADPNTTPAQIQEMLDANPELANRTARYFKQLVNTRFQGDPDKMAYAWHHGHNNPDQVTPENLEQSEYVKRFRNLRNLVKR
jgi:hypothetical protein